MRSLPALRMFCKRLVFREPIAHGSVKKSQEPYQNGTFMIKTTCQTCDLRTSSPKSSMTIRILRFLDSSQFSSSLRLVVCRAIRLTNLFWLHPRTIGAWVGSGLFVNILAGSIQANLTPAYIYYDNHNAT